MKYILVAFSFFVFSGSFASAYELTVTEVEKPYDAVPVTLNADSQSVYLGALENFPIMYEVEVEATTTLSLSLSQQYRGGIEPVPFALMIVRKDNRGGGVAEVARFYPEESDWTRKKDSELGLKFLDSKIISNEIGPGVYHVEVSTPENIGKFSIFFGETDESAGYFERLGQVRTTQDFYGYSLFKILTSSLLYYPLGILFLLFVIQRIFKYKKAISDVT